MATTLSFGTAEIQGEPSYMEDGHVCGVLDCGKEEDDQNMKPFALSVFDGHGGDTAMRFVRRHFHRNMTKTKEFEELQAFLKQSREEPQRGRDETEAHLLARAMKRAVLVVRAHGCR